MAISSKKAAGPRASRSDGAATRSHILDIAGQVFADKGYAHATSKEICTLAGTNMAAVNYHFGSKDGLYEAVLIEAHQQIVSLDELAGIAAAPCDARLKLRAVLSHFLNLAARPAASWGHRVIMRELMMPSPIAPSFIKQAVVPKAKVTLGLMAEILELPTAHPSVQRSLAFVVLPCLFLLLAPKDLVKKVLPALGKDTSSLIDDLLVYALAGADALAKSHPELI